MAEKHQAENLEATLRTAHLLNDQVGNRPVLIVHQPTSDAATAFIAQANGKTLRFRAEDAEADKVIDLYANCIATICAHRD